jgi:hypothetical protein
MNPLLQCFLYRIVDVACKSVTYELLLASSDEKIGTGIGIRYGTGISIRCGIGISDRA